MGEPGSGPGLPGFCCDIGLCVLSIWHLRDKMEQQGSWRRLAFTLCAVGESALLSGLDCLGPLLQIMLPYGPDIPAFQLGHVVNIPLCSPLARGVLSHIASLSRGL